MGAFDQQVAIVTGGAGGIGGAVAKALRDAGATVVSVDRTELDVSKPAEMQALVKSVVEKHSRIDLLVNVAGVVSFGSAESISEAEWDRVIDINLKGTFFACQAVIATMKRQKYGRIVNVGSVVGKNAGNARPWIAPAEQEKAANAAYGASKAGVHAITGFLAKEMAAHGVTVNAVAPGPIATAMTTAFPEALRNLIPVGRMGSLDDVARAILFLGSKENGFINGEILDVNGGMLCD